MVTVGLFDRLMVATGLPVGLLVSISLVNRSLVFYPSQSRWCDGGDQSLPVGVLVTIGLVSRFLVSHPSQSRCCDGGDPVSAGRTLPWLVTGLSLPDITLQTFS